MLYYEANESLLRLSVCFHFFVFIFNAPPITQAAIEIYISSYAFFFLNPLLIFQYKRPFI